MYGQGCYIEHFLTDPLSVCSRASHFDQKMSFDWCLKVLLWCDMQQIISERATGITDSNCNVTVCFRITHYSKDKKFEKLEYIIYVVTIT